MDRIISILIHIRFRTQPYAGNEKDNKLKTFKR